MVGRKVKFDKGITNKVVRGYIEGARVFCQDIKEDAELRRQLSGVR